MKEEHTPNGLFDAIEVQIRRIIREEVKTLLSESAKENSSIGYSSKPESVDFRDQKHFPTLLTAKEASELLGLKPARIYELARAAKVNGFPVTRIGERSMRFSKEALVEWVNRDRLP